MPKYYHKYASVSLDEFKSLRIHNYNNMIVSFLNINTIRNKLDNLKPITDEKIDIDKPYRLEISEKERGLLIYIKSNLPSRLLSSHNTPNGIQVITFEFNLRKEKWLFMCIYRSPNQSNQYFL